MVGDIAELARRYCRQGADELVFYDITASPDGRTVDRNWISHVAATLDIPFCVAGGIRTVADAEDILRNGADKISINSPALDNPELISELAARFGSQCVVLGVDSRQQGDEYHVYKNTGDVDKIEEADRLTIDWIVEAQERGVGEVVLNCINRDGVRQGYDCKQLRIVRENTTVPLVASGGAGERRHFAEVFDTSNVDAALAASVFHNAEIHIGDLKRYLSTQSIDIRL